MKIKHWMTSNPLVVKPHTLVIDAAKLMRENQIRRLPVVDRGKVVGMITHRNILEASPSAATTLSVHELNYLLANLKVEDVMQKDPICVSPEDTVMDVVKLGHEKKIGAFPVVQDGRLVGIVTETEIYRSFVQILGYGQGDHIIVLENVHLDERVGAMSRISGTVEQLGVPILALFSLPQRRQPGSRLYLRVHSDKPQAVKDALVQAGYKLGD
jgi:acetoin utilization protein AcuB